MISTRSASALLAAVLLLTGAAGSQAQPASGVEGTCCLAGVREVGSCLRLSPGGRFEWFLSYGAYDEDSEGTWRMDGSDVVIDSLPYDRKPTFTLKGMRKADGDGFDIVVVDRNGREINAVDVKVRCDGREADVGMTGTAGYRVPCTSPPQQILLGISVYGVGYQTLAVPPPPGADKAYVIELDPGDVGKKRLAGVRLQRQGNDTLVMRYTDTPIQELAGKDFPYLRE